jgi:hypothetical protein
MVCTFMAARLYAATPLHHYTFDDTGVVDSAGSANGSLVGGAAISSGMLALNGTDAYVQFAENLIPPGNFSVAFFAQELSPAWDRAEVISQGHMFGPGFYVGYYPPARTLRAGDQWQNTGLTFADDRLMHHYAVSASAVDTRLYVNGVCVATNSPIRVSPDGDNTRLGCQFDPWGEFFHGNLDEVWVYDGALTAAEVAQLAAVKPHSPNLSIEVSQVRLCWPSQTNVTYQVQYRSPLTMNEWTELGAPTPGSGATECVFDEVVGPCRYYRVVALP